MKKHELLEKAMRDYPKGTMAIHEGSTAKHYSTGLFKIKKDDYNGVCVLSDTETECFYSENTNGEYGPTWAVPVKESILSGKCAIQVNNEREFKLLMEHYECNGWISQYIDINKYPYYIDYKDKFDSAYNTSPFESRGEKIIPFKDFAVEIGIEVPVFVMTSEDGVPLYVGDEHHIVSFLAKGEWWYNCSQKLYQNHVVALQSSEHKAFSTKEAAEAWIKEHNKPKEIKISHHAYNFVITKDSIQIFKGDSDLVLDDKDVQEIYTAYKSLQ